MPQPDRGAPHLNGLSYPFAKESWFPPPLHPTHLRWGRARSIGNRNARYWQRQRLGIYRSGDSGLDEQKAHQNNLHKSTLLQEILVLDHQPDIVWLMPQFMIRVELYGANGKDYLRLHAAMDDRGFQRTIVLEDDSVCMLPTAEYLLLSSSLTTQQVLNQAQSAAQTVSNSFGVLAVQVAEAPWVSGLKAAR